MSSCHVHIPRLDHLLAGLPGMISVVAVHIKLHSNSIKNIRLVLCCGGFQWQLTRDSSCLVTTKWTPIGLVILTKMVWTRSFEVTCAKLATLHGYELKPDSCPSLSSLNLHTCLWHSLWFWLHKAKLLLWQSNIMEINCSIRRIVFCHQANQAGLLMDAAFALIKTEDLWKTFPGFVLPNVVGVPRETRKVNSEMSNRKTDSL